MIDWNSFLSGVGVTALILVLAISLLLFLLYRKFLGKFKGFIGSHYTRTSLIAIALIDIVAGLDPTQTVLTLPIAVIGIIIVGSLEWFTHHEMKLNKLPIAAIEGIFAGLIIAIPFSIAGIFLAVVGTLGDKRRKR